jgi:hypothetical protein
MNAKRALSLFSLLFLIGLLAAAPSASARPYHSRMVVGVRVNAPPPALRREAIVVRPGRAFVWIPGHWDWLGPRRGYVWVPGVWLRPPRAHAVWVAPRWERRGRSVLFFSGHWRY